MRAVSAEQMRQLDRVTIEEIGIPGVVLMENAGRGATAVALEHLGDPHGKRVAILCGRGSNGGDGFVIARHLANRGAHVECLLMAPESEIRGDPRVNLMAARRMGLAVDEVSGPAAAWVRDRVAGADLIVDALLGTGVRGEVVGPIGDAIDALGDATAPVLAVDIPSGVCADTGQVLGRAVRAVATVTFALPKIGLLQYPGRALCGGITQVDIGIPAALTQAGPGDVRLTTPAYVAGRLSPRAPDAHKGDAGRVLVLAGSTGFTGAAVLAASSAARAGAGLVFLGCPATLNPILEQHTLEPMTIPLAEGRAPGTLGAASVEAALTRAKAADAMALGPGLGRDRDTLAFAQQVIAERPVPLVLDADGIIAAAQQPECVTCSEAPIVITPHPGELSALIGEPIRQIQSDRVAAARRAAERFGAVVVLKGAGTVVAAPDGTAFINPTGNPGMASGGMGDVLTGIAVALLARRLPALDAAVVAAYVHGLAADLAAQALGAEEGLLAGDLLPFIPRALAHAAAGDPLRPGRVPRCI